jgi:hypothetical protein
MGEWNSLSFMKSSPQRKRKALYMGMSNLEDMKTKKKNELQKIIVHLPNIIYMMLINNHMFHYSLIIKV